MNIEAKKLLLEALEFEQGVFLRTKATAPDYLPKAIESLRKAIEQAEKQEPMAHWSDCAVNSEPAYPKGKCDCGGYLPNQEPVAPQEQIYKREWVGLTAKEVVTCWHVNGEQFWRNIEAKLKEKNSD